MAKQDVVTLKDGTQIDTAGLWSVCWNCRTLKRVRFVGMRRMKKGGLITVQPRCTFCRQDAKDRRL